MDKSDLSMEKVYSDLHMDTSETFAWTNYSLISSWMHQKPLSTETYLSL